MFVCCGAERAFGCAAGGDRQEKELRTNYRVRRALASHPHTPRLVAMRLLRDLHLMDLVRISLCLLLRRNYDASRRSAFSRKCLNCRWPKIDAGTARVGTCRGRSHRARPEQVARIALGQLISDRITASKTLAKDGLPSQIVAAIAKHKKWSNLVNVRIALLRHPCALWTAFSRFCQTCRGTISKICSNFRDFREACVPPAPGTRSSRETIGEKCATIEP